MPGLIACNRRWDIGSDDLMFPALAEISARLLWLIAIAVVFNTHKLSFDCSHGPVIRVYYIGILVVLSCHILLNVAIVYVSMRGTIMDQRPRKNMAKLLYIKLGLFVPELLWTILGTYWAFDLSSDCQSFVVIAMKVAALVGWFVMVSLSVALLIVFDPLGSRRRSTEDNSSAAVKLWETRCRVICCCAACDDQHSAAFTDAAKLFAQIFQDVDIVATDIAVGLLLVHQHQKLKPLKYTYDALHKELTPLQQPTGSRTSDSNSQKDTVDYAHENPDDVPALVEISPSDCDSTDQPGGSSVVNKQPRASGSHGDNSINTPGAINGQVNHAHSGSSDNITHIQVNLIDNENPSDNGWRGNDHRDSSLQIKEWMSVENAAHYMAFSLGTYTWPVYMYMNLFCGACKLCKHYKCCDSSPSMSTIIGDNCCQCHLAAVQKITKADTPDILYANFTNQIYEVPFYVALDHKMRAVVIAIRGTMSLKDCLTDMSAESANCYIEELGEQYVHKGILQTAKYIQNTLDGLHLLNTAFQRAPGYNLVVTGHSLGAGVATLLAILLRPSYRYIQCFAFSPPGWLLSLPLSKYTEDFVCSVVIGEDLVPRLGIRTMEKLKIDILKVLRDANKPKYQVLAGGCWRVFCGNTKAGEENSRSRLVGVATQRSYTEGDTRYEQGEQTTEKTLQESVEEAIHESDRSFADAKNLFMPGVVLYLHEEEPTTGCFETPIYRADWARQEQFQEIVVTPKMLADHLPDVVLKALRESAERGVQARCVLTPCEQY